MSDPFDRLREGVPTATPDVGAIRARARGIQRRRYLALGSSATVIAIVAMIGVLLVGPERGAEQKLAQATPQMQSAAGSAGAESATTSGGAAQTAPPAADIAAPLEVGPKAARTSVAAGQSVAAPALDVTLEAKNRMPRGADFTLKACNKSGQTIEHSFNTSQRYDFEVKREGRLVWRWSDGMAFAQVVGNERWKPGECKTWNAEWDGRNTMGAPASPGTYQAVGILKASQEQRTKPKNICLDIC